jgi:hypothetical protein
MIEFHTRVPLFKPFPKPGGFKLLMELLCIYPDFISVKFTAARPAFCRLKIEENL